MYSLFKLNPNKEKTFVCHLNGDKPYYANEDPLLMEDGFCTLPKCGQLQFFLKIPHEVKPRQVKAIMRYLIFLMCGGK
jgi:hypothetical protein